MTKQTRYVAVSSGKVRPTEATFENRQYLVVPVVALVEGVIQAMNAPNPEFVSAEEFSKFPGSWNGRPVVVDHPVVNGEPVSANTPEVLASTKIGIIFNAAIKKGKLAMEAWIDIEKAAELEPEMLERLQAGDPIEISVGLFCETEDTTGVFGGKKFAGAWHDLVPDHLALLSKGSTGACSREMGCGVRAAKGENMESMYTAWLDLEGADAEFMASLKACRNIPQSERDKMPAEDFAGPNRSFPIAEPGDVHDAAASLGRAKGNRDAIKRKIIAIAYRKGADFVAQLPEDWKKKKDQKAALGFLGKIMEMFRSAQPANKMGNNDLRRKLYEALEEKEPGVYCSVVDWYPVTDPAHVVYEVYDPNMPSSYDLYERAFTLDADGVVTVADVKIEVEPVMSYEPVEGAGPITAAEGGKPCGCHKQKALTEETDMTKEALVKALENATPEQIKALGEALEGTHPAVKAAAEATAKAAADVKAAEDKAAADVKAAQDKAAADVKAAQEDPEYVAFKAAAEAKKTVTIKSLKDTGRCDLTDEQLKAMSQKELDGLVKLAGTPKAAVDFSGQAPRAAEGTETTDAPAAPDMQAAIKANRAKK